MIDAFLELYDKTGQLVQGESTDDAFPHRIEVDEFEFGDGTASGDDEEKTEKTAVDADAEMQKVLKALDELANKDKEIPAKPKKTAADALDNAKDVSKLIKELKKKLDPKYKDKEKGDGEDDGVKEKAKEGKKGGAQLTFSVKKDVDSASADLFQAFCRVKVHTKPKEKDDAEIGEFRKAIVYVRKMIGGDPHPYLVCTFNDVRVTSYTLKWDSGRAVLVEDVDFKFVSYQVKYQLQTSGGAEGRVFITDGTISGKAGK